MNNRYILFLLVFLLIYINIFIPLSNKNRELKQKMLKTEYIIEKDKLYLKNQILILNELNQSKSINNAFLNHHFYEVDDSKIFNIMQKEIKKIISISDVKEDNIKWGESYISGEFKEFPMSVRVYGSVRNLGDFFESLFQNRKIHIKNFILRWTKKYYILELTVYGLKLEKE